MMTSSQRALSEEEDVEMITRGDVIRVVAAYLHALGRRDHAEVPFASDVILESPTCRRRYGKPDVLEYLSALLPAIDGIRIKRHIIEGNRCATMFELDTRFGTIPALECFLVEAGELREIVSLFDLSPATNAQAAAEALEAALDSEGPLLVDGGGALIGFCGRMARRGAAGLVDVPDDLRSIGAEALAAVAAAS